MKLNTLLLTSAATLMVSSVAFAADLPSKKAAPSAGSVQVCKVGGKTGFQLPGSDTCVVISGYYWVQAGFNGAEETYLEGSAHQRSNGSLAGTVARRTVNNDDGDNYGFGYEGQVAVDALSNTEMGVLSSHLAIRAGGSGSTADFYLHDAYLQLGGFKAGNFDSTFSMLDGGSTGPGAYDISSSTRPVQFAYSAALGNGVTLGVALEQSRAAEYYGALLAVSNGTAYTATNPLVTVAPLPGVTASARQVMPDVVGTLDFTSGALSVHLGGAWHEINNEFNNPTGISDSGYAGTIGVKLALDSMGKGSFIQGEFQYADGAVDRLASVGSWDGISGLHAATWDAYYNISTNAFENSTGYSVGAEGHFVLSPKLALNIWGAYEDVEGTMDGYLTSPSVHNLSDVESTGYVIGAGLDYEAVKNFHIKPAVNYKNVENVWSGSVGISPVYDYSGNVNSDDLSAVIRIQRDF